VAGLPAPGGGGTWFGCCGSLTGGRGAGTRGVQETSGAVGLVTVLRK